ncbi:MAG TPA: HAD family hydrolase [Anaerolineales bacterium]|nr:HAD family hydrolase [Anaerolineales bacterium]
MSTLKCKAILFDLDGTLVDSATRVQRLWLDWSRKHDIDPHFLLEVMHGRRADETIRIVAPHLSLQEEFQALEEEEILDMDGVRPYPRARELLSQLSARQWAIVTSGTRRVAGARMAHVGLPAPAVFITADDVTRGKPAPNGYLLAARRLELDPAECVVIEDAPAGIQAGKAAGMRVIAVGTTLAEEALNLADVVIKQLAEIHLTISPGEIQIHFDT